MERVVLILGRIALVAAAVTAVYTIVSSDGSVPSLVLGGAMLLAAGFVANRAWAAGLPFAAIVVLLVFSALAHGTEDHGEMGWWGVAYLFAGIAGLMSLLLLLGVGIRRAVRAARDDGDKKPSAQPRRFSPQ